LATGCQSGCRVRCTTWHTSRRSIVGCRCCGVPAVADPGSPEPWRPRRRPSLTVVDLRVARRRTGARRLHPRISVASQWTSRTFWWPCAELTPATALSLPLTTFTVADHHGLRLRDTLVDRHSWTRATSPEGRKIVICKAFLIDNIDPSLLPSDNRGRGECFAVCCGRLLRWHGHG
jgi:hypothetical protein